jgi:phage host-nuclease inhibitor protein Gam
VTLTDADQLREALRLALAERDEHKAKREEYASEARSLRARLAEALHKLGAAEEYIAGNAADFRRAVRDMCERQREACAEYAARANAHRGTMHGSQFAASVRATPLVTEPDWWAGEVKP